MQGALQKKGGVKMNIATIIAVLALAVVVFLVIRYLVREKRKGNKCIGCPYAGECQKYTGCGMNEK